MMDWCFRLVTIRTVYLQMSENSFCVLVAAQNSGDGGVDSGFDRLWPGWQTLPSNFLFRSRSPACCYLAGVIGITPCHTQHKPVMFSYQTRSKPSSRHVTIGSGTGSDMIICKKLKRSLRPNLASLDQSKSSPIQTSYG